MLASRGSNGITMVTKFGPDVQPEWRPIEAAFDGEAKFMKVMNFSPDGNQFAYSDGKKVYHYTLIKENGSFRWIQSGFSPLDHQLVSFLDFSPSGSVLSTWNVFSVKSGQSGAEPNLRLWNTASGLSMGGGFIQKKAAFWKPQWSKDEKLCCFKSPNNEVLFFEDKNFETPVKRLSLAKMDSFSLTPNSKPGQYHLICFVPGQKGGPGFGKMFTYPNFNPERDVVANKSFFQADRMDVEWSADGNKALLLTQSEVDKTGGSYYGKQKLHFMTSAGDTAAVQLAKDGPIYSIKWSPNPGDGFCVVYGYMPARATLYNNKCEKSFDFGTGPRNFASFNPQGNLLLLGGFGNLRGNSEIWALKEKKEVCKFEATDATDIRWSPDGHFIMTSTCAPRLRQGNGLRIFHYSSALLFEQPVKGQNEELWEVQWRNESGFPPPFQVEFRKTVKGIEPQQPQASKQAYIPPSLRNKGPSNFRLHEDEPAENQKKSGDENMSKSAAKNKKRREAAKKKQENASNANNAAEEQTKAKFEGTGDPEKDKKLMKLNKTLTQIEKLKEQRNAGKQLELNQLEKLKKEAEIIKEIEALRL